MAEATEKSFPFDSEMINGEEDRLYLADDFARYFRKFLSSGTFMKKPDNLQIIANGDMTVKIKEGSMNIEGYGYELTGEMLLNISSADGVLHRIDRIAATWSKKDRDIHITKREGTFSYEPVPPECRRTAEYKDYVVADILVRAGTVSIMQEDITDQRLNTEVCGLAIPFAELDTSTLALQLQDFYKNVVQNNQEWEEEKELTFEQWFDTIKDQLSGDVAGNLQVQIGTLSELNTEKKDNLVEAVNEVLETAESKIDTGKIIKDLPTLQAVTEKGYMVDATVVKEVNNNLIADIYVGTDGKLHKVQGGADSVLPFNNVSCEIIKVHMPAYENVFVETKAKPVFIYTVPSSGHSPSSGSYCSYGLYSDGTLYEEKNISEFNVEITNVTEKGFYIMQRISANVAVDGYKRDVLVFYN